MIFLHTYLVDNNKSKDTRAGGPLTHSPIQEVDARLASHGDEGTVSTGQQGKMGASFKGRVTCEIRRETG